jgi:hypothetical protein
MTVFRSFAKGLLIGLMRRITVLRHCSEAQSNLKQSLKPQFLVKLFQRFYPVKIVETALS